MASIAPTGTVDMEGHPSKNMPHLLFQIFSIVLCHTHLDAYPDDMGTVAAIIVCPFVVGVLQTLVPIFPSHVQLCHHLECVGMLSMCLVVMLYWMGRPDTHTSTYILGAVFLAIFSWPRKPPWD